MNVVDRIRKEMEAKNVKQVDLIEFLNASQSNVSKWLSLNEKTRLDIPNTILFKIADYLEVDAKYLVGLQDEKHIVANNTDYSTLLPIVNLHAGAGSEGIMPEVIKSVDHIPVSNKFLNGCNPEYLSVLQIAGDSMMPTLMPNDWIIVDMVSNGTYTRNFEPIDGLYLINRDGSIQIKRLAFRGTKGIDIISDNPRYPKHNTIDDGINLEVIGKLFKHISDLGALVIKVDDLHQ